MLAVYQRHRAAEEARNYPAARETLTDDCFLEHVSLRLRSDGKADATRLRGVVRRVPRLRADPRRESVSASTCSSLSASSMARCAGLWLGLPPTGREFTIPLVNIVPFRDGLMAGERLF
jgi:hypothetical protein